MTDALLTTNDQMEGLSRAYISALCARAGYTTAHYDFDRNSVDIIVGAGGDFSPEVHVQLKATTSIATGVRSFSFPLSIKNYNDLRARSMMPRVLVVLALPKDEADWLSVSVDQLVLRRIAYWKSLKGMPDTDNTTSVSIPIETSQVCDVAALQYFMAQARAAAPL